jgi:hypothetical protein
VLLALVMGKAGVATRAVGLYDTVLGWLYNNKEVVRQQDYRSIKLKKKKERKRNLSFFVQQNHHNIDVGRIMEEGKGEKFFDR